MAERTATPAAPAEMTSRTFSNRMLPIAITGFGDRLQMTRSCSNPRIGAGDAFDLVPNTGPTPKIVHGRSPDAFGFSQRIGGAADDHIFPTIPRAISTLKSLAPKCTPAALHATGDVDSVVYDKRCVLC